jgi:hypothetical protein
MKYEQVKHLKPGEFKRFWGVTYETFEKMVEIVTLHEGQKKTLKSQVLVNQVTGEIICTAHGQGKCMISDYLNIAASL